MYILQRGEAAKNSPDWTVNKKHESGSEADSCHTESGEADVDPAEGRRGAPAARRRLRDDRLR